MAVEKKQILNKVYLLTGFLFLFAIAIMYKLVQINFVDGEYLSNQKLSKAL